MAGSHISADFLFRSAKSVSCVFLDDPPAAKTLPSDKTVKVNKALDSFISPVRVNSSSDGPDISAVATTPISAPPATITVPSSRLAHECLYRFFFIFGPLIHSPLDESKISVVFRLTLRSSAPPIIIALPSARVTPQRISRFEDISLTDFHSPVDSSNTSAVANLGGLWVIPLPRPPAETTSPLPSTKLTKSILASVMFAPSLKEPKSLSDVSALA